MMFWVFVDCSTRGGDIPEIVVIEPPEQTLPGRVITSPAQQNVQSPRPTPPPVHTLSIPAQVKNWLMERKYQIKNVGDVYHITRKDTRSGNVYDINLQLSAANSGLVSLGTVTFEVSENVLYVTVNGVGEAGFRVDGYGNLRAVDPHKS